MTRCPAHGNRIQLNPSRAVNLVGATPQPDCRRTVGNEPLPPVALTIENVDPPVFAVGLPASLAPVLTDGFRRAAQLLGDQPAAPLSDAVRPRIAWASSGVTNAVSRELCSRGDSTTVKALALVSVSQRRARFRVASGPVFALA